MASELLSPAGDFVTALAAFEAGADAVYCGLNDFSARAFAKNFSFEDLAKLLAYARKNEKKVYVTFNTLLDEDQFEGAIETLAKLEEVGPDGVIVQDLGVAKLIRERFPALTLHASTQLVAHNLEGVLALKELGFKRVVLARELSLEEIISIAKRCGEVELEVFIHGALCYSLSGLCLYGAMEKGRSGNRGKCPYCCRQRINNHCPPLPTPSPRPTSSIPTSHYPFSMKDLRLGEDARKLVEAGVASLKIEGRMKSALYVASVTKYYRDILDGAHAHVTPSDLESVFSRRTTKLYFNGRQSPFKQFEYSNILDISPIDPDSLGHLGTLIGIVKKVTRDREGLFWLRFHTSRALEKHDGLQFDAVDENGKHLGMGIVEMRQAISRHPVFEVNAGVDVEILLTDEMAKVLKPGMKIYCSMSNAVKRLFPTPSFRPSDYQGGIEVEVEVEVEGKSKAGVSCRCNGVEAFIPCTLETAKNPEKTEEGVRKAFSKLGGTGYRLGRLSVDNPEKLFVPMSVLNDLRRDLVEKLDDAKEDALAARIETVKSEAVGGGEGAFKPLKRIKLRAGQRVPVGDWDEIIVAINDQTEVDDFLSYNLQPSICRVALPVYTDELCFNKLRSAVKRFLRAGYDHWEASDLATLRMLKAVGITDITADWTLYAFNARSLAQLAALGVKRTVASPENNRENLQYLAESGYDVEFLTQQSTPLFISLTEPQGEVENLAVFVRDGLWVTTKRVPRTFDLPDGVSTRLDLSWDAT